MQYSPKILGKDLQMISMMVAHMAGSRAIGADNDVLWRNKIDMDRFRKCTRWHPVIMGRKTWESLPEQFRPLPMRTNIVVSRSEEYLALGAILVHSLSEALATAHTAPGNEEKFIIGGGELYHAGLQFADRLYVTRVYANFMGDVFFPEYELDFSRIIERVEYRNESPRFDFLTLERKR